MEEQTRFVYNADGVPFTIYKSVKPTKSGPKTYWLLEDFSTGKRRTLNNVSRKAAERRADQLRAAMVKGQAHRALLSNGQWQDVCMAVEILRSTQTCTSLHHFAQQSGIGQNVKRGSTAGLSCLDCVC